MATPIPHVEFRSVSKRFGNGPVVLDGLSLSVQPGEFVSLIGPSGCGKSTILRLVAALSRPTGGELLVDGAPPARGRRDTAFIFQDPTLLPWLTVQGNIEVPLRIRGTPRPERQRLSRELLQLVRLDDVRERFPRQLSGGMRMRVSVARALVQSPRLLLMDEPFGALDEMTRHHLNEELLEIRQEVNWTAFFVTHSVAEAVFLSSRIVVLAGKPGRILADVTVPFAYPRAASLRGRPAFHALVDELAEVLRRGEEVAAR